MRIMKIRILFLKKRKKKESALKTELDCKIIKVSALEDLDSEISLIQNFINVLKDNKIKEL